MMNNPQCFANHMGLYLMEPMRFNQAVMAIKSGLLTASEQPKQPSYFAAESSKWVESGRGGYYLHDSGIAVIHLTGSLMKGQSKYGGTSTVGIREALRAAENSADVTAVLLAVDSPGGHVAGTQELADQIGAMRKPVAAHADDLMASAAYWPSAQASDGITANRTAEVGSIGTVAVVEDSSAQGEKEGVVTHVISTGAMKGAFVDGAPITDAQLEYLQERVDSLNAHFLAAVKYGRGLTDERLKQVSDGRCFCAYKALELGLIDGIMSLDAALAQMVAKYGRKPDQSAQGFRPRTTRATAIINGIDKI